MTRIEVTSNDDMTEAHLKIAVPEGTFMAHVTFHIDGEENLRREAAVQGAGVIYLPNEGPDAKHLYARYQDGGVDVTLVCSLEELL